MNIGSFDENKCRCLSATKAVNTFILLKTNKNITTDKEIETQIKNHNYVKFEILMTENLKRHHSRL
jgi:hypothetical protein